MIQLPSSPRRCDLRGFVIALSIVGGAALGGLAAVYGGSAVASLMAVSSTMALVLVVGLLVPGSSRRLYDLWNRLSRTFGRVAGWWVTRVAFFVVAAAGRGGSRLPVSRPSTGSTGWVARDAERDAQLASQSMWARDDSAARGWLGPLLGWARTSGNWWMWTLAPYLALLSTIRPAARGTLTHRNYTLY